MPKVTSIAGVAQPVPIADLDLDGRNPRLSIDERAAKLRQPQLMSLMLERFELEELGESLLTNGFFTQEPLVACKEHGRLVIIEGNRRLAALRLIVDGAKKWGCSSRDFDALHELFAELTGSQRRQFELPLIVEVKRRRDAIGFIGFRHVTGVKTWPAIEKAGYIAHLAEDESMSAYDIARAVGSKPTYVLRHYRAYRMIMQAREEEIVDTEAAEKSFGVFMRALQAANVHTFLGLKATAPEDFDQKPIRPGSKKRFAELIIWLFGTEERAPLITDSRRLTDFGRILGSDVALDYLRASQEPSFEKAYHLAGGAEAAAQEAIRVAEYALRDATPYARGQRSKKEFRASLRRCADFLSQMLVYYPDLRSEFFAETAS